MDAIISIVSALAIPILWGLASAWLFEWLRERRLADNHEEGEGR